MGDETESYVEETGEGVAASPEEADPYTHQIRYLPPPPIIRAAVQRSEDGETVTMPTACYRKLLEFALHGVFDAEGYCQAYPDVKAAIESGGVPSAFYHFMVYGYGEGRAPARFAIDEAWYLETYPDVAQAISDGRIASAAAHFTQFGYAEGRAPSKACQEQIALWRGAGPAAAPAP